MIIIRADSHGGQVGSVYWTNSIIDHPSSLYWGTVRLYGHAFSWQHYQKPRYFPLAATIRWQLSQWLHGIVD
jgi:hypothetical protein